MLRGEISTDTGVKSLVTYTVYHSWFIHDLLPSSHSNNIPPVLTLRTSSLPVATPLLTSFPLSFSEPLPLIFSPLFSLFPFLLGTFRTPCRGTFRRPPDPPDLSSLPPPCTRTPPQVLSLFVPSSFPFLPSFVARLGRGTHKSYELFQCSVIRVFIVNFRIIRINCSYFHKLYN